MNLKKPLKRFARRVPLLPAVAGRLSAWLFPGSRPYWQRRYERGGDSGEGSCGHLAAFKAEFLNAFVAERAVRSVIEFGCGDGNQLALAGYPSYIGLDISRAAIERCREQFAGDRTKSFYLYDPAAFVDRAELFRAELALSLDVIYHLTEDAVYERYMAHLFAAAERLVIVYSSNQAEGRTFAHMKHRRFTDWVSRNAAQWQLDAKVDNKYPYDPRNPEGTSVSDFYVFERDATA